jgi:hypothetical protein
MRSTITYQPVRPNRDQLARPHRSIVVRPAAESLAFNSGRIVPASGDLPGGGEDPLKDGTSAVRLHVDLGRGRSQHPSPGAPPSSCERVNTAQITQRTAALDLAALDTRSRSTMQRARRRCLSFRSVNRSCAPGRGRSLRTMTRIPAGQDDRSRSLVMSATHVPYLTCPSPS